MDTMKIESTVMDVLATDVAWRKAPIGSAVSLARKVASELSTLIDTEAGAGGALTEAQVRAHPLYREQVRRTQDAQRDAANQRAELDRIRAIHYDCDDTLGPGSTRPERVGPITHEPTELGAVIVAVDSFAPSDKGPCVWIGEGVRFSPWRCTSHGTWRPWDALTASRWATATERATGKVDPKQDEAAAEAEASGHPERLWSNAEYDSAPIGTRAGSDGLVALTRKVDGWHRDDNDDVIQPYGRRRVTRWGYGPGWEPGADVTDRLDQAPKGVILVGVEGDFWRRGNDDLWDDWLMDSGEWYCGAFQQIPSSYLPLTVATNEQMREAGILTDGGKP